MIERGGKRLNHHRRRRQKDPRLMILALVASATMIVLYVYVSAGRQAATQRPAAPAWRTVLVAGSTLPRTNAVQERICGASPHCQNGKGGILLAHLLQGTPPAHRTVGTVLTDMDCTPDAYGISHCHYAIRLKDGTKILIREDHNMQYSPCLRPGEKVWVEPPSSLR